MNTNINSNTGLGFTEHSKILIDLITNVLLMKSEILTRPGKHREFNVLSLNHMEFKIVIHNNCFLIKGETKFCVSRSNTKMLMARRF